MKGNSLLKSFAKSYFLKQKLNSILLGFSSTKG